MNITLVNSPSKICGVQNFGLRTFNFLKELGHHSYTYTDSSLPAEKPDAIIFNWHIATMSSLKAENVQSLQGHGIKVGIIPHNENHPNPEVFDFILHDNCDFADNDREIGLPRVIMPFEPKSAPIPKSVGTFGFAFSHKNWEGLAQKIDKEYGKEGILRIKATPYPGYEWYHKLVIDWIKDNTSIQLDINEEFATNEQVIEWLSLSEINAFPYIQHPDSKGQTTVIDFALASKRPLCISDSALFNHIRHIPKISFNDNSFREVIDDGIDKFKSFYDEWTKEKLVEKVENLLDRILTPESLAV